jgi:hypothetical protein
VGGGSTGGDINIETSLSDDASGKISIKTGRANSGNSGTIEISTGTSDRSGSNIILKTGFAMDDNNIILQTGESVGRGNDINLKTGSNNNGAGNIILEVDSTNSFDPFSGEGDIILTPHPGGGLVKVSGSGTYTGTWTQASDKRFKNNIEPIINAVDKVQQLNGVRYEFKSDEFPEKNFADGKQIGLIAQDVEKVLPELVKTDNEGYKSVAYQNMVAVLIEAVKEQQKSIDELKKEVLELKSQTKVETTLK